MNNDTEFRMQVASDVIRDGLGVELLLENKVVAEVFRWDAQSKVTVSTFNNDVPLVALESLILFARQRLDSFEGRTELPKPPCS